MYKIHTYHRVFGNRFETLKEAEDFLNLVTSWNSNTHHICIRPKIKVFERVSGQTPTDALPLEANVSLIDLIRKVFGDYPTVAYVDINGIEHSYPLDLAEVQ